MRKLPLSLALATALALFITATALPDESSSQVTVARGESVQIAFAADLSGFAAFFAPSVRNAIQMAIDAQPVVRGFPVHVSIVDAPCGSTAEDVTAAQAIVADRQNVGVLGQMCSAGFAAALSVFERAQLVTISGSASADGLPDYGPTVFNRTTVSDGDGFDAWYAVVAELPADRAWQDSYTAKFGVAPLPLSDLYYDAAGVLIRAIKRVSYIENKNLVIDRARLAAAVRRTTHYEGVTCTVRFDSATGNRVVDLAALGRCA
jgi:ABC-type branched-subunit amino acid transport system substrate-binding protein